MILFKYKSIEFAPEDKTYSTSFLRDCRCLLNNQLWFSSLKYLNDPFEGVFQIDNYASSAIKLFKKNINIKKVEKLKIDVIKMMQDTCGILSLTTDNQNLLMWSHYTNNQKGYCLEFDLEPGNFIGYNNKKINSKNVDFKKVSYSNTYPKTSILNSDHKMIFGFKSKCWNYEKEYRFISNNSGLYTHNDGCLKTIYLGSECDFIDEILLCSIAFVKGAKVYKAKLFSDKFELYFLPYDLESLNRKINCQKFVESLFN
ncbi:DUF2971 domain-containing protein [Chryseobacterium sp. 2VB]|uniref:DUF2971 domain-containing protein n=1 Tax=Chryseobacterium sp. 2VB TaxID=2502204 RepID=UPI0010F6D848|nr:DUF2971 domain-containing protein [Chryseobacterium sp. 2VB]